MTQAESLLILSLFQMTQADSLLIAIFKSLKCLSIQLNPMLGLYWYFIHLTLRFWRQCQRAHSFSYHRSEGFRAAFSTKHYILYTLQFEKITAKQIINKYIELVKSVNKCKHLFWSKNRYFFFNIYSANCRDLKSHEHLQKVKQDVRQADSILTFYQDPNLQSKYKHITKSSSP